MDEKKLKKGNSEIKKEASFIDFCLATSRILLTICISTADSVSDIVYISSQTFANANLFYLSLLFCIIPPLICWIGFRITALFKLASVFFKGVGSLINTAVLLSIFSTKIGNIFQIALIWTKYEYISIFNISPANVRPEAVDTFPKFLILCASLLLKFLILPILLSILLIILSFLTLLLAPILGVLFAIFILLIIVITTIILLVFTSFMIASIFLVPSMKLIYFPGLFLLLTGKDSKEFNKEHHMCIFNFSVVSEVIFESIPQLTIICMNVFLLGEQNLMFYISSIISVLSIINTLWPFGYAVYSFCCKKGSQPNPLRYDLFSFEDASLSPEKEPRVLVIFIIIMLILLNIPEYIFYFTMTQDEYFAPFINTHHVRATLAFAILHSLLLVGTSVLLFLSSNLLILVSLVFQVFVSFLQFFVILDLWLSIGYLNVELGWQLLAVFVSCSIIILTSLFVIPIILMDTNIDFLRIKSLPNYIPPVELSPKKSPPKEKVGNNQVDNENANHIRKASIPKIVKNQDLHVEISDSEWSCPRCTLDNLATSKYCVACKLAQPVQFKGLVQDKSPKMADRGNSLL